MIASSGNRTFAVLRVTGTPAKFGVNGPHMSLDRHVCRRIRVSQAEIGL
jgi:hypothetical protein